ncbi:MAG: glycosyltransferase family 4 protein, partial [Cytophagales bacterium]|nr:glycosyltransferase family 4 protein [Cytophagales bacterium]
GWYLKSYIQALVHCKSKKIPVSVRGDSQLNPNDSGWKYRAKKWLYPLFLRQFTKILYVGERNKAYLLHFGARPNQLLFSPHVVDQGFWKRDPTFPISQKPQITFLWVGKFIEKKRPLDAIAACMNTRNENIRLVMVGTGELWEESKLRASSDPRISFVGFKNQTELKSWYAQADALVLTSDFGETWGLVVNEAFAQGIPAIVSNACGSSQGFVNHGINGFVYPLGNIEKLAQLMEDFAQNYDKWMPIFQQNIPEANSMYSFETNRKAIATFLEVAK